MDDDEYGDADDILTALADAHANSARQQRPLPPPPRPAPRVQPLQQPVPQRLDRPPPPPPPANNPSAAGPAKPVQPTPQALPPAGGGGRGSGSSILVSPRQKGNPVLACLKSVPWEYSDIPADYGLGSTTCALFLSLKYHRLHPEYIYTRIRNLQGRYNLRVLLTLVDVPNHEDSLRELSKTSLINGVTVVLAWSAAEAARYLELYKAYEHAGFAAIRGQQAEGYAERLVGFVTAPRNINKADAVALVSSFGSLRRAVNATPDQISAVSGWGEKKVRAWCKAVEEPFRVRKRPRKQSQAQAGRGLSSSASQGAATSTSREEDAENALITAAEVEGTSSGRPSQPTPSRGTPAAAGAGSSGGGARSAVRGHEALSEGVAAALARLRNNG
ncbi:hypothetical protein VTJ83DRAFT_5577 [Remersonia thermophila]|uniref:ERCC1-like central domain-containing protein n=1 Tax=Remersonia thermophila TaxID=72144 RepID=A0ABR4D7B0_9PEZI